MRDADHPGVAALKLSKGVEVDPSGGMTNGTSVSTFGECHASVTFRTGLRGTMAGASLLEPMYDSSLGNAVGGSEKSNVRLELESLLTFGNVVSPPRHREDIDPCRTRKSIRGAGVGDKSAVVENVVR